jgi:hypothetical protein
LFVVCAALEILYCSLRKRTWLKVIPAAMMVAVGGLAGWFAVGHANWGALAEQPIKVTKVELRDDNGLGKREKSLIVRELKRQCDCWPCALTEEVGEQIREMYQWFGFFQAVAEVSIDKTGIDSYSITARVKEGPQYRLGEVGFSHVKAFPVSELRKLFNLVTACYLDQQCDEYALEAAKAATSTRWQKNMKLVADLKREPGTTDWLLESLTESANRMRDHLYGIDYSARTMANDDFHRLLEPQLRKLVEGVEQAFVVLRREMKDRPPVKLLPLEECVGALESEFTTLRQNGTPIQYGSDELLRFYSLFYRLRHLANELDRSLEFANALEHSTSANEADA